MMTFRRVLFVLAGLAMTGLSLGACTDLPNPNPSSPFKMPDGRIVQPPPGGWPSYDKGGESGRN